MFSKFTTKREGQGEVWNWASLLEYNTQELAEMISRHPLVGGMGHHVALMPDAHLGVGAAVGSAIMTEGGIIPAAVGVDIGCGMRAVQTNIDRSEITQEMAEEILEKWGRYIPSGVGENHKIATKDWDHFVGKFGEAPTTNQRDRAKAPFQFGTLGSGNHFAEACVDQENKVWLVVHSGSRGVGNGMAQDHIKAAQAYCNQKEYHLEHKDMAYLEYGTPEFAAYEKSLLWGQEYALWQRKAMMKKMIQAVVEVMPDWDTWKVVDKIDCHHNYTEVIAPKAHGGAYKYLSRKGAINAEQGARGIIPGSMGDKSYIVTGLGNEDAYNTAPHGAGRLKSRGAAKRELDADEFEEQMEGVTWQKHARGNLLDEAPLAYKPIDVVMEDSKDLVRIDHQLKQFINFKGTK